MKQCIMSIICAVMLTITCNQAIGAESTAEATPDTQIGAAAVVDKIDLNSANSAVLTELPGIGPKTAEKIEAYRESNGPFKSIDDLLNVKGIGPAKFEKLKPFVTVS